MILVTGGLGYIGSHTVVELLNAGYEVVIVDNLSNSRKEALEGIKKITAKSPIFLQIDIKNFEALEKALSPYSFEGVIHFAALKAVGESEEKPLEYYENNILGLINILKLGIDNFIFSSSCTVYGQAVELPITEEAPLQKPESVYANTKLMGEEIVRDYVRLLQKNAILLRYFNPIGAHPSAEIGEFPIGVPNNLVPYITQTAAGLRKSLSVFGNDYPTLDGTAIRDYIYVVDLANAHIKALSRLMQKENVEDLEIFNLGTGMGNSVLEVIQTFENANNIQVPYHFAPRREGDIVAAYADATKAKEILGWDATTTLDKSLQTAWQWQKNLSKKTV